MLKWKMQAHMIKALKSEVVPSVHRVVAGVRLLFGGASHPGRAHHSVDRQARPLFGKAEAGCSLETGSQTASERILVHLAWMVGSAFNSCIGIGGK